ncbi:MAG: ribonuclease P protein component [Alteromonadaceae bacterium]|nr:ribonuclease P protein component [Alteromonadaceae bacterium]
MGSASFTKEQRLLKPAHFEYVFQDATPAASPHITVLARLNSNNSAPRLGITIPKKKVKLAVQRNRIKRLVRESFRLYADQLPNADIIVIGKSGIGDMQNNQITDLLEKQWRKIVKRCKS